MSTNVSSIISLIKTEIVTLVSDIVENFYNAMTVRGDAYYHFGVVLALAIGFLLLRYIISLTFRLMNINN